MDNNYLEININGVTYYIQADRFKDLAFIDNRLVNISNSNIVARSTFSDNTTYPYLSCSSNSQCRIIEQYNNYSLVGVMPTYTKFNFNTLGSNGINTLIFIMLFILVGVQLWKK